MTTPLLRAAALSLLLFAGAPLAGQQALPPAALPRQHIVMVVDNSNSMDMPPLPSDPLRLRGVAASLVLDAAELSSDVEAGLVLFDGDAQSDQKLHPPDVIRQRLDGQRLPPAGSGTNIKHALEIALSMLSGSTASIKRIVLITDGMPWPPSQQQEIIREVVPNAERAGVQIFALGLSEHIDQAFLDAVTRPTGGKTLIALQHQKLLQSAKQLMGDHDNVFTLADKALPAGTNEYKFTITAGVDRARITAILDHPRDFAPGDLTFTLDGPASAGERTYTIRPDGGDDRVAAWTAFFSTPGTYTLRIETANGHKGLRLFIEALSNLRVQATLSPPEPRHAFGSEVSVQVQAATASGTVARDALKITGTVQTPGGGTEIIAFNGLEGRFKVRDVAGRHTVVVKAQTDLARAETRVEYEAIAPEHGHLSVTPEKLEFVRPLGPSDPKIETTFKLVPEFPEGTKPRSLKVGFMLTAPSGQMELVTGGGAAIKANGPAHFTLPPAGADIIVRIKLDPHRPLPREAGRQTGEIRIFSAETAELILPLEYQVRIPAFEVEDGLESFALWWDPARPRTLFAGSVHSDLASPSTFTVTMADSMSDPNHGTLIAGLALRAGGRKLEGAPAEAGKVRYGPIELAPGDDLPLQLVVTPHRNTGWQNLPATQKAIEIELVSDLGMRTKITPKLQTLGPPLWGRIDHHGRPVATGLLVGLIAAIVVLLALSRLAEVRRFRHVRPGLVLPLGFGPIQIGAADGDAALVLPNSGSPLDNEIVGKVSEAGRRQRVESVNGYLVYTRPELGAGDTLAITPDVEDGDGTAAPLWELNYVNVIPGAGGEVEVIASPARWTLRRVVWRFALGSLLAGAVYLFLATALAAALAYHLRFIEHLYLSALG